MSVPERIPGLTLPVTLAEPTAAERAIFDAHLALLPKGAQINIREAMARNESLSWDFFRLGLAQGRAT